MRCNFLILAPIKDCGKDNKLGVKGVCLKDGKYVAKIQINGKRKHLGYHDTIDEAAAAYAKAANDNHGPFARTA
jgi:hypothetical protein